MFKKIEIIYEDNFLIIINKPAGLVVHNPPGKQDPSVVDYIVRHIQDVKKIQWPYPERPGIVHRLDKDTSGLMIIAKTPEILEKLQAQFKERSVQKEYVALCYGYVSPERGSIMADIARHASKDKQTVIPEEIDEESLEKLAKGVIRQAQTDYDTLKHYEYKKQPLTLILAKPKTGRMHQIRIHLKHLGFPIIGDPMYFFKPSRRLSKELNIYRQFLHAVKLTFVHPETKKKLEIKSDLSPDLQEILNKLS
jgi:23S rRNA pseudouridine1911/1915/1917 synthase